MKMIGIIGGVSWESTALYYKWINEAVRAHLGGLSSAKILLSSLNYEPIVELERQGRWTDVAQVLADTSKVLEEGGAEFIILCCNTLHKVASSIENSIRVPFLHIADAAGKVAFQNGIRKIGLLGTQFTMEDGFYASRLNRQFGLEVLIPQEIDRRLMDDIIYKELCLGKVSSSSKKEIIRMVQLLQISGAEAILLGCTELGTLVSEKDLPIPVYDTTFLHVQAAVRMLLGKIEKTV